MKFNRRIRRTLSALTLLFLCGGPMSKSNAATLPSITVEGLGGGVYQAVGQFSVLVSSRDVWEILVDYDRIGKYVSSIESCKVKERRPDYVLVEQINRQGIGFLHRRFEVLLKVKETPQTRIDFEDLLKKSFDSYSGSWEIESVGEQSRITHRLQVKVSSVVPAFLIRGFLQRGVGQVLNEVKTEIERKKK